MHCFLPPSLSRTWYSPDCLDNLETLPAPGGAHVHQSPIQIQEVLRSFTLTFTTKYKVLIMQNVQFHYNAYYNT